MKRVACLIVLVGIVLMASACRKDVFVDLPASLSGEYIGTFTTKDGTTTEQSQPITWRFTSNGYRMRFDEEQGTARLFCDSDGTYEFISGQVELQVTDPNQGVDLCNTSKNPEGFYAVLHQPEQVDEGDTLTIVDDTLKMAQVEGTITRTIKLVIVE